MAIIADGMKRCPGCMAVLPITKFHKHPKTIDGAAHKCKTCALQISRAWYAANKERRASKSAQWASHHPDFAWAYNLKKSYGLTVEQYEAMLRQQNGVCAICGEKEKIRKRLGVDHSHKTGAVRALLCHNCNAGIGNLKDSQSVLRSALAYLEKHGEKEICG